MKITGNVSGVYGVYDNKKGVNRIGSTAGVSSKKDVVSISNNAKDFQTVMKAIKEVPDVRQEKVSALTDKYEAGSYNVAGSDTADKIIKSILDKKL
jgi:negative regulator of flagellin synthesis FlgM